MGVRKRILMPQGKLFTTYIINKFKYNTVSCGNELGHGVGARSWGKSKSTSWGRFQKPDLEPQLRPQLHGISYFGSWGFGVLGRVEVELGSSWRSSLRSSRVTLKHPIISWHRPCAFIPSNAAVAITKFLTSLTWRASLKWHHRHAHCIYMSIYHDHVVSKTIYSEASNIPVMHQQNIEKT
jgi:hypothetical protein